MRALLLLLVATGSACSSPHVRDCTLTCGVENACPDGLQCASDGLCRFDVNAPACLCTCDPLQQSCCAGGETCDLVAPSFAAECRSVSSGGEQGERCQAPEECGRTLSCVMEPDAVDGTCHRFCSADGDCAGGGGLCALSLGMTTVRVCTTGCNPFDSQGCPSEFSCIISYEGTGGGRAWTDCRVHGDGDTGASCTGDADCKREKVCRGAPAGTCTEYCSTADSSTCPSPMTCMPLDQSGVVIGGIDWGYCG